MQRHITGRHVEITDDVRSYVEKRVKKIEAFFNRIIDLQLVIELEKTRYFTEIVLATAKATFHAQGETHDIFSCLDTVMDKIERPDPPSQGKNEGLAPSYTARSCCSAIKRHGYARRYQRITKCSFSDF